MQEVLGHFQLIKSKKDFKEMRDVVTLMLLIKKYQDVPLSELPPEVMGIILEAYGNIPNDEEILVNIAKEQGFSLSEGTIESMCRDLSKQIDKKFPLRDRWDVYDGRGYVNRNRVWLKLMTDFLFKGTPTAFEKFFLTFFDNKDNPSDVINKVSEIMARNNIEQLMRLIENTNNIEPFFDNENFKILKFEDIKKIIDILIRDNRKPCLKKVAEDSLKNKRVNILYYLDEQNVVLDSLAPTITWEREATLLVQYMDENDLEHSPMFLRYISMDKLPSLIDEGLSLDCFIQIVELKSNAAYSLAGAASMALNKGRIDFLLYFYDNHRGLLEAQQQTHFNSSLIITLENNHPKLLRALLGSLHGNSLGSLAKQGVSDETLLKMLDQYNYHLCYLTDVAVYAAAHGRMNILEYLFNHGVDINCKSQEPERVQYSMNITPITAAAREGQLDCVKFLHERGAKISYHIKGSEGGGHGGGVNGTIGTLEVATDEVKAYLMSVLQIEDAQALKGQTRPATTSSSSADDTDYLSLLKNRVETLLQQIEAAKNIARFGKFDRTLGKQFIAYTDLNIRLSTLEEPSGKTALKEVLDDWLKSSVLFTGLIGWGRSLVIREIVDKTCPTMKSEVNGLYQIIGFSYDPERRVPSRRQWPRSATSSGSPGQ